MYPLHGAPYQQPATAKVPSFRPEHFCSPPSVSNRSLPYPCCRHQLSGGRRQPAYMPLCQHRAGQCKDDPAYQFLLFPTNNMAAGAAILPGQSVYIKSVATGRYCRIVVQAGGARSLACDAAASTAATPVTMGPAGLSIFGVPLVNPGSGQPVTAGGTGTTGSVTPGECC